MRLVKISPLNVRSAKYNTKENLQQITKEHAQKKSFSVPFWNVDKNSLVIKNLHIKQSVSLKEFNATNVKPNSSESTKELMIVLNHLKMK